MVRRTGISVSIRADGRTALFAEKDEPVGQMVRLSTRAADVEIVLEFLQRIRIGRLSHAGQ
jgi:hypothetical protein